jgi:uncharacterized protein
MGTFTNRLAKESSPYLLQHAHNPVDWFPWGEEALQKAVNEEKPILVSIGYAACHWCHVMENESFEDEQTAAIMNEHFICIKIDREERPDLDHIYMDAVQAMTGSGGWPLNVFLTPDKKPFYGGTYFPPKQAFNRPSWKDVLHGISKSFREKKHEINAQAENLVDHLSKSNSFGINKFNEGADAIFNIKNLQQIFENIMKAADKEDGGFGKDPKFPQTFTIQFLLHYYYFSKNDDALKQACLSIDKMIAGGIYDQIGGGFARYSTDKEWLVPHFEKMLYDNALLIIVISEAYQLTKKELYLDTIMQTMGFINRELLSPDGGFYSALDADSEGEEGKYYVWQKKEIDEILKEDAELFCAYYDVTELGNWEEKNILRVLVDTAQFSKQKNITEPGLEKMLEISRKKLLAHRAKRIRPLLDDKILLSWNALMNIACSKAFAASGEEVYKDAAIKNMNFLLQKFPGNSLHLFNHSYKESHAKFPAFLDDYSFLIAALIQLQEITSDTSYLLKAKEITAFVIDHFSEEETGFFFYTHKNQEDVIIRKKEVYDGATPSGNSFMTFNLFYLSIIFDNPLWKERAIKMCSSLGHAIIKYPSSFSIWAILIQANTYGVVELVITGENLSVIKRDFLSSFIPYRVFQSATRVNNQFPLLKGKSVVEKPLIFLCKDYSCQNPVTEISALIRLLKSVQKFNSKPVQ